MKSLTPKLMSTAVLTVVFGLAACETTPPPPPPSAVLDIAEDKVCDETVDLIAAQPLMPKKAKKWYDEGHLFNAGTSCLRFNDANVNYMVFELPAHASNHVITVGGAKNGIRTLAADISILAETGEIVRTFGREKYMNIGGRYGVQFRPLEGEKYVLVTTNPELVGEEIRAMETKLLKGSGYIAGTTGAGASYTTYSGAENITRRTYSHEGVLSFRVQALSGKIGLPEG